MNANQTDSPYKPARRAVLAFLTFFVGLLIFVFAVAFLQQ